MQPEGENPKGTMATEPHTGSGETFQKEGSAEEKNEEQRIPVLPLPQKRDLQQH